MTHRVKYPTTPTSTQNSTQISNTQISNTQSSSTQPSNQHHHGGKAAHKSKQQSTQGKYQAWWQQRENTFMLPPMYAAHAHAWERIDVECVGCTTCGVVHVCGHPRNVVPCRQEQQPDSSIVCTMTGVVLANNSLFDSNVSYVDFAKDTNVSRAQCVKRTHHPPPRITMLDEVEFLWTLCVNMGALLLTSECARTARETEQQAYVNKASTCFARHLKRNRSAFEQYNLLDALEATMLCVKHVRVPSQASACPPLQHLRHVMREMVELMMCLELPKPYQPRAGNDKIQNLVIALYYIAIDGITAGGHVFLTQCLLLKPLLPLQLQLWPVFKLQPKLITEGENVVKMCIKNLSPIDIAKHGLILPVRGPPCLFERHSDECTCEPF